MKSIKREDVSIFATQSLKEKEYWLETLAGELTRSTIPYDYTGTAPAQEDASNSVVEFQLPGELYSRLMKLSNGSDSRLHMILTAAAIVLLKQYTGSNDIIVGATIEKQDFERDYINTILPLRNKLDDCMTFKNLLLQIRKTLYGAIENQNYPIEFLLNQLDIKISGNKFPLFDILILLENIQDKRFIRHIEPKVVLSFRKTDNRIRGAIEYSSSLYEKTTIDRIIAHYSSLMDRALRDLNQEIANIEILSEVEKKQLLVDFNHTTAQYPRDKTINQLFTEQVEKTPDNIAVIGKMHSAERKAQSIERRKERHAPCVMHCALTYRELNQKSRQLAHVLQSKDVKPDTIVGIMMERSIEMIIGILGILKAGGAYLPIDPDYPEERSDFMLKDSRAKVLLAAPETQVKVKAEVKKNPGSPQELPLQIINIKTALASPLKSSSSTCRVSPTNLAYVIYTSGSTGSPKGVLVQHNSVVNLAFSQKKRFKIEKNDRILQFSSICFDASVEQLFIALFSGAILVLIDKNTLLNSDRFDQFICRHAVTHIHAVPSFLNTIGLKRWNHLKRMIAGGDLCPVMLAKHWSSHCDFYNEYGPTETTVTSIEMLVKNTDNHQQRIPIGKPIDNTFVYLLDKEMNLVPLGVPGELYIGGDGVACGYLNQPGLTAEKFLSTSYSSYTSYKSYISKRIYKTGDLARWLPDGNIEFLDRIDFQVKIRGFRIEPEEIKHQLLKLDGISEAVVVAQEDKWGETYLAAYFVAKNQLNLDTGEIRTNLTNNLPTYMIPAHLISLERIPLTLNGKVDLKALPAPETRVSKEYIAPRNELEKKLVGIWSDVLGIQKEIISIDSNFFELGGHSLNATRLIAKQQKILDIKMPVAEIFKTPTIRKLAKYIKGAKKNVYHSIQAVEKKEYYPASSAQKRMIILNQLKGNDISDNVCTVICIEGDLDVPHLEKVVRLVIEKHEAFRTLFTIINENHVQQVHQSVDFGINYMESQDDKDNIEGIIREFIRPFDLTRAPLLRVGLIQLSESKHILIFDMHHIISDAVSREILTNDFLALFRSEKLPELKLQYKDFTCWQNEFLQSDIVKKAGEYWLNVFSGEIPLLVMPIDYPRPPIQSFEGDYFDFEFSETLSKRINRLTLKRETTLYMVLLAIYTILLSKYSGQEDIVVGTPIAGRPHTDLENIIGFFVNTLAMRNYPQEEKTFTQFLEEVKINALKAYENQDYQFEELVEKLELTRDQSRSILFDTMFALQNAANIPQHVPPTPGNTVDETTYPIFSYYQYKEKGTQFDIITHAFEIGPIIRFKLRYATKLFARKTIEKFIKDFNNIAEKLTENIHIKLKDIQISHDFTDTNTDIHQYDQGDFEFLPERIVTRGGD